jgi:hypothetical protein
MSYINLIGRVLLGLFFLAAFSVLREDGAMLSAYAAMVVGAMAFISPTVWNRKIRLSYWISVVLGGAVFFLVLLQDN